MPVQAKLLLGRLRAGGLEQGRGFGDLDVCRASQVANLKSKTSFGWTGRLCDRFFANVPERCVRARVEFLLFLFFLETEESKAVVRCISERWESVEEVSHLYVRLRVGWLFWEC
ncbi:uncharacterized protein PV09_02907 [Verruconis gallopava]|uniref:Uncharacterized protein n=1 Tax=Verruconis gallopava TaxID=253628 RepID=A0A0D2AHW0_9PEZI|nr:uncharacterized protein PV09_02907 [Verruconis gallopava]KIW06468.1 hypothetical protein PV09_02907 [Verruconis gallopava]